MKIVKRSISVYISTDRPTIQRNYSVPCVFGYHEADDNDMIDGEAGQVVRGQPLPLGVLECLVDAHEEFSEIYNAVIKPEVRKLFTYLHIYPLYHLTD